jgi:Ca-activated chloride channel family protein
MSPFLFLLLAPFFMLGQGSAADREFKISSDVELVLLDASVKDSKGGYASGLTRDNFQIYENGILQKITEFAHADIPVTVGLVMDESRSMGPNHRTLVTAGVAFVESSNRNDQVFVVNFNDLVRPGLPKNIPFSDDVNVLRAALSKDRPEGRTAMFDAIAYALKHLESGTREKKALVVVTDGGDNASERTRQELMQLIQESRTTIYTVGIFDPEDRDRNPGVLKRIAHVSGGECFLPGQFSDVVPICQSIARDIRNRYTIGYAPTRTTGKVALRKIRVTASAPDREKLIVHTRTSYVLPERVASK